MILARVTAKKYYIKIITNSDYINNTKIENCEIITIAAKKDFKETKNVIKQIIKQTYMVWIWLEKK